MNFEKIQKEHKDTVKQHLDAHTAVFVKNIYNKLETERQKHDERFQRNTR